MSCIVGLNDAEDEQNKWVRVLKEVEEVCTPQQGHRKSAVEEVVQNRSRNAMGSSEAPDVALLGREGVQEQRTLRKITRIQRIASGTVEAERHTEATMFQVRPSKLVIPTKDEPLSMFDASTWAMSFPDLFPWGDGVPFLKREVAMDATEVYFGICCCVKNLNQTVRKHRHAGLCPFLGGMFVFLPSKYFTVSHFSVFI